MRVAINPWAPNDYDQRMVSGIAEGFRSEGHEAVALPRPLVDNEVVAFCREHRIDVWFDINRTRPPQLAASTRHVNWFQDPLIEDTLADTVRSTDIVYYLSSIGSLKPNVKGRCRVAYLPPGVAKVANGPSEHNLDMSLVGFIPPNMENQRRDLADNLLAAANRLAQIPLVGESLVGSKATKRLLARLDVTALPSQAMGVLSQVVADNFTPLGGDLDIPKIIAQARSALAHHTKGLARALRPQADFEMLHTALGYARRLDRIALATAMLSATRSVSFRGGGWRTYPQFAGFAQGPVLGSDVAAMFRRSRINCANNTGGVGVQIRSLEVMAVGGVLFFNASPFAAEDGGMHSLFAPEVHYVEYTAANFVDTTRKWLRDEAARRELGARARQCILDRHLWRHRAKQIVDDLKLA